MSCLDNSIGLADHHFLTENNLSRAKKAHYDDDHSLIILTFNHDDHPDHFVISHGIPGSLPAAISERRSVLEDWRRLEVPSPACRRMFEALELLMVVVRWGMVMMHRHV